MMEVKKMKTKKHFIGMAGLYGYLPIYCDFFDSYNDAVESLADLHELGKKRRAELKKNGFIELNLHKDGNEYAEITECDCSDPSQHSDY